MAIFRNIQMSFWTDADIIDEYSPEDKFFYLYLLTNPHTNLCGCYEVSFAQISMETGYDKKKIELLIERASDVHNTIRFSKETKEILIVKWSKYNWTESEKFRKPLLKEIQSIKNEEFKAYLMGLYNGEDTVSIPYTYGIDTTVTITDTITDTDNTTQKKKERNEIAKRIIDHLNQKCGTQYKASSKATRELINGRLDEGFTEKDFYTVIDKKAEEWTGTKLEEYLRPQTLFCSKFEGYLNQKSPPKQNKTTSFSNFEHRDYDYGELNKQWFGGEKNANSS